MDERFQNILKRIQLCKDNEFKNCIPIILHLLGSILATILYERQRIEREENKDLLLIEESWSKYKEEFYKSIKLLADHTRNKLNNIRNTLGLSLSVDLKWYTTLLKSMIDYYNTLESQLYTLETQMYKTEDEWIKSRIPRKKPQDVMEREQKRKDKLEESLRLIVFNIKYGINSKFQISQFEIWKVSSASESIDEIKDTKTILKNAINELSNNYIMRGDEVSNYTCILDEIEALLELDSQLKDLDDIAKKM